MSDTDYIRDQIAKVVAKMTKPKLVDYFTREAVRQHEGAKASLERDALLTAKVAALEEQVKGLSDVKKAVAVVVKLHSSNAPVDSRQLTFMGKVPSGARNVDAGDVLEDIYRYADDIVSTIAEQDGDEDLTGALRALRMTEHEWGFVRHNYL